MSAIKAVVKIELDRFVWRKYKQAFVASLQISGQISAWPEHVKTRVTNNTWLVQQRHINQKNPTYSYRKPAAFPGIHSACLVIFSEGSHDLKWKLTREAASLLLACCQELLFPSVTNHNPSIVSPLWACSHTLKVVPVAERRLLRCQAVSQIKVAISLGLGCVTDATENHRSRLQHPSNWHRRKRSPVFSTNCYWRQYLLVQSPNAYFS